MMRDVMQNAGLQGFAELAIMIFFATFAAVAFRTFFTRTDKFEGVSRIPLDDDAEVDR